MQYALGVNRCQFKNGKMIQESWNAHVVFEGPPEIELKIGNVIVVINGKKFPKLGIPTSYKITDFRRDDKDNSKFYWGDVLLNDYLDVPEDSYAKMFDN